MSGPIETERDWRDVACEAQAHRDRTIAEVLGSRPQSELPQNVTGLAGELLSDDERSITETLPEDLVLELAEGKLTSTKTVQAFLRRAAVAQCLVSGHLIHASSWTPVDCDTTW